MQFRYRSRPPSSVTHGAGSSFLGGKGGKVGWPHLTFPWGPERPYPACTCADLLLGGSTPPECAPTCGTAGGVWEHGTLAMYLSMSFVRDRPIPVAEPATPDSDQNAEMRVLRMQIEASRFVNRAAQHRQFLP